MSKNYLIEHENGITKIKFYSKPTYNEAKDAIDDIAENFPYEKRLWDLNNVDFDFSTDEIIKIAAYGKSKFLKPNRIALIASDDLVYGEMRQFMVYREEESKADARVFRTEEEAINWLSL